MNSSDLLKMAVGNLWRRKTRTLLTILGVVIGTASIVVMLSLGIAMEVSLKEQMDQMGDLNVIEIYNYGGYDESDRGKDKVKLDDDAVNKMKKIPDVQAVMPIKRAYLKIAAGRMVSYVPVIGINPEVMEAFDFKVEEGRLLLPADKDTIVFGKNIKNDFYNPRLRNESRWGQNNADINLISNNLLLTTDMDYGEVRRDQESKDKDYTPPTPHKVKGVGVLEESFSEKDYNAYMNISVLEKLLKEDEKFTRRGGTRPNRNADKYESIKVKVKEMDKVEGVNETLKNMGYQTFCLTDIVKSWKEMAAKTQAIFGGIGAVSLLVAAIGITNTMIMSIYERTREIGVMKVIGAKLVDIKKLFLIEASIIGFGGGVAGLIFSYGVSHILNKFGGGGMMGGGSSGISIIPIRLALGAIAFSTMIGLISGYSPAKRAMKLSALEAIKNE